MRDYQGGAVFAQTLKRRLDALFAFVIQRTGCFIQHQNMRVTQENARDGDTLLLAT